MKTTLIKALAMAGILIAAAGSTALMAGASHSGERQGPQPAPTAELATFVPPSFDIETSPPVESR